MSNIEIPETIIWKLTSQEIPYDNKRYLVCFDDGYIDILYYDGISNSRWFKNGSIVHPPIYWAKVRTPIE